MSVYVDAPRFKYRGQLWCHMIADSHDELDDMAQRLGLKSRWIQKANTPFEHYDLAPNRRESALRYGALEVSSREIVLKCLDKRGRSDEALPRRH